MDEQEVARRVQAIMQAWDPPTPMSRLLARAAFETRQLDEELAELVADSFDGVPELVRGAADTPRMITFESSGIGFEIEILSSETGFAMQGLVSGHSGSRPSLLEVQGSSTRSTVPDQAGWFAVDHVETGPMRLRLHLADGQVVVTSWVNLAAPNPTDRG